MKIVGFDVGYRNLAYAILDVDENFEVRVKDTERVDISEFRCDQNCPLHHTSHVCDLISHFFFNRQNVFKDVDLFLIERQPPGGLKDVEALLFNHLRDKAILISPNALQRHFAINHLTYDERKERVVRITGLSGSGRLHDMADAILIAKFHVESVMKPKFLASRPIIDLDRFRY